MQKIAFNQITKTYNGNGTYTIPSHVAIEDANKAVGYNVYNADSVSDRRCKIALTKINKAIEEYGQLAKLDAFAGYEHFADGVWFYYSENFVAIDINGRASTVYVD